MNIIRMRFIIFRSSVFGEKGFYGGCVAGATAITTAATGRAILTAEADGTGNCQGDTDSICNKTCY